MSECNNLTMASDIVSIFTELIVTRVGQQLSDGPVDTAELVKEPGVS